MTALRSVPRSRPRIGPISKALLVAILLIWPLLFNNSYAMAIMTSAGLYAMLTVSVVIILGQAGQLSFGHSAFYGIGAYVAGLTALKLELPTALCLILGAVAAGVVAVVIGRPVLKLKYFYLALATIGLGQIFLVMVVQLRTTTGGTLGFAPVPPLSILGFEFGSSLQQYYLVWIVAFLIVFFVHRALKHRMGRALRAIATSEIASATLGIRTANWKMLAFVTAAVICGLAGGLYAFTIIAVGPRAFTFSAAIIPIIMMLIGVHLGLGGRAGGHPDDMGHQGLLGRAGIQRRSLYDSHAPAAHVPARGSRPETWPTGETPHSGARKSPSGADRRGGRGSC